MSLKLPTTHTTLVQFVCIAVLLLTTTVKIVSSDRILFLLPLASRSHKIFFEPFIRGLAEKGHELTVLTSETTNPPPWKDGSRVEEIVALPHDELMKDYPDPFLIRRTGKDGMTFPFDFVLNGCHKVIQSDNFQLIMNSNYTTISRKPFDLMIVDVFLSNCLDGFIAKTGIPFILATTMPAPSYISERVGNFLPPSTIPVLSCREYQDSVGEMSFYGRAINFLHFMLARLYVNYFMLPKLERVYKQYLGDDSPGIFDVESKAEMIFMNSHYSMNFPRPLLPDLVEVGGIHCREPRPLTNTGLANFISKSAAPHGFIYFSVGTMIRINEAPVEFMDQLFSVFGKLKQRVVIKWRRGMNNGGHNMTCGNIKIPDNVWIDNWFPQQDLLGHENIRLFISHGGLLSLQEAVYHSVPVLGIPFVIDQETNLYNAVLQGYALKLDYSGFTEESFSAAITRMLENPSFSMKARQVSQAFRQRQSTPLETAVYWTEYVLKRKHEKGINFLESPARKMNVCQYYSCDIIAFFLLCSSPFIWMTLFSLVKLLPHFAKVWLTLIMRFRSSVLTLSSTIIMTVTSIAMAYLISRQKND